MDKFIKLTLALFTVSCFSFTINNHQNKFKADGYVFIPSGNFDEFDEQTVQQGFYMSATEVSNEQYRIFLSDLKASGNADGFRIANIDSTQWNYNYGTPNVYMIHYHSHPAYNKYPVVNISYEGALLYCEWLSKKYRAQGLSVTVQLPTEKQWIYAAAGGNANNKFGWEGNELQDKKKKYKCNFKQGGEVAFVASPSKSYVKNKFGLYNMSGNVAEMLNEPGTHKGGSWWSDVKFIEIVANDEYSGQRTASPYIGFRPVIVIEQD